ncbi:iron chaperone [Cellulosimicrobium sp. NPDC057127]|uniref:iron chaperone n=1 Tax=Cellulosimicrobium sp. NPDC057127 TaxID=3346026 RepID=UPI00363B9663
MADKPRTVDEYVAALAPDAREVVAHLREVAHATVAGLEERISYGIPTFTLDGHYLVYLAGWAHHVSLYPVPDVDEDDALARRVARYRDGKGTLRFPLAEPVPDDLVRDVVARLAAERRRAVG